MKAWIPRIPSQSYQTTGTKPAWLVTNVIMCGIDIFHTRRQLCATRVIMGLTSHKATHRPAVRHSLDQHRGVENRMEKPCGPGGDPAMYRLRRWWQGSEVFGRQCMSSYPGEVGSKWITRMSPSFGRRKRTHHKGDTNRWSSFASPCLTFQGN